MLVNLSLMALQLGVGRTAGAQAMVADGILSLVDVVVDSVIALSVWLAHRRTGPHIGKLVPAASALVSVLIVVTGIEFMMKGFSSAPAADDIVQGPIRIVTFAMAFAAIAVKAGLYYGMNAAAMRAASAGGNADSTNALKAGAWHACVDSISAGVAAIGTAGTLAGWPAVDRTATAVIGAMILGGIAGAFNSGHGVGAHGGSRRTPAPIRCRRCSGNLSGNRDGARVRFVVTMRLS